MSIIKANTFQDRGGNTILSSDGSGNVTAGSSLASSVASVGSLANTPSFGAKITGNQSIANDTDTKVAFDTVVWDTDSAFSTSTYRFTVPTGKGGK